MVVVVVVMMLVALKVRSWCVGELEDRAKITDKANL